MVDVKILLVEDESITAMDIKRTLELLDYDVPYVASSGDEALEKATEIMPDLILIDIVLKGEIDGIETASKIKDLNIPVIFLTAHSEASTIQKAKLTEPYGYLLKPYDVKELKLAIEMALSYHEMRQRLKEVINGSPIPQFFIDNDHRVVYWNKALEKYSGIKAEEVIGTDQHWKAFYSKKRPSMVDLLVDNDSEKLKEWYSDKYHKSELVDGAYEATDFFPNLGEDGKWIYFTAVVIKDSKDDVIGALETLEDVTDRKEAEEALRESERNYRELVGNSMAAIYKTNLKGDIIFANDAMVELFDFESVEALKTKKATQLYKNPKDRKNKIEKLRKEGSFSHQEVEMVSNDGKTITILLSANLADNIISGMMIDISERKKSEKELERSENRYRAIFENSGSGILTFRNDGTIIMSNSEWERLSGYSREEVEGKMKWMELIHPDYLEKMMEYHRQRVKDPDSAPQGYETVFIKKSGDLLMVYVNVTPLPGTDMWLASALNITDLKNTQKKLEKSVLRFRALAEYALDGIITTDAHGKILYFNKSLLKMFGYSKDELINSQLTILMPVRYRENFMDGLRKFRLTGEHRLVGRTIETTGLKKDGDEFPFEMSLTKWKTDKKNYFTSIIRDISERKKAEDTLKESLKEKEILLREIHHRVKNNMEIISSLLKLQIKQVDEDEAENVLKESQGRVRSMAMVHENLYRSKSFSKINFKNYVENLVSDIFYSYGIEKGIIEPELEIEDINIDIDIAISLGLIINELVTNSVKYAFPQGKGTIKIKLKSNQDQMELIIADNGVGLPNDLDYKNTDSLGLQLVTGLVDQIDAEIEREKSHGTKYKITFKNLEPTQRIKH